MSFIPKSLLNSDDDWQESLRQWLYPKLHPYLEKVGGPRQNSLALRNALDDTAINYDIECEEVFKS